MESRKKIRNIRNCLKDDGFLKNLYNQVLPQIERHVIKNSGTRPDAQDLFQESMIILFKKVNDNNFELTSSLETFVFSIAKNRWLYELRKRKPKQSLTSLGLNEESNEIEDLLINEERSRIYLQHFESLSDSCKEIMLLFFKGTKMEQIASKLLLSSEGYARKKKHECQGKLLKSIKLDPRYKELLFE